MFNKHNVLIRLICDICQRPYDAKEWRDRIKRTFLYCPEAMDLSIDEVCNNCEEMK